MNTSPLSIIATLSEALRLGVCYLKFLLILALLTATPSILLEFISNGLLRSQPFLSAFLSLAIATVMLVVGAMKTAAILGVLKNPPLEAAIWPVIKASIQTYTWTLFRLSILLALIAGIFTIPIVFLMSAFLISSKSYAFQIVLVFLAILYLVFVKFALADPLVVVEGMGASSALGRSWHMTKGCFGFVLGCYVFLGTTEYFIGTLFSHFETTGAFNVINVVDDFCTSLFECLWILTAWCMYGRIKTVEDRILYDSSTVRVIDLGPE